MDFLCDLFQVNLCFTIRGHDSPFPFVHLDKEKSCNKPETIALLSVSYFDRRTPLKALRNITLRRHQNRQSISPGFQHCHWQTLAERRQNKGIGMKICSCFLIIELGPNKSDTFLQLKIIHKMKQFFLMAGASQPAITKTHSEECPEFSFKACAQAVIRL